MMTANDLAIGLMKKGDFTTARAFVTQVGESPAEVQALAPEDNIFGDVWQTGEGFLRLIGRLKQVPERPIYRIVNRVQGTFWLPQYDELMDVSTLKTDPEGLTVVNTLLLNIQMAALGLGMPSLDIELRDSNVSDIFPFIYLTGQRRHVGVWWTIAGFFSEDIRAENRGIRRFRYKMKRLEAMYEALESSYVFALKGWFALLRDIVDGKVYEPLPDDCEEVKAAFMWASVADQRYALLLLRHAELVMGYGELQYGWPKGYVIPHSIVPRASV